MKNRKFEAEGGKSVIEMLIVLAVTAILVTIAVSSFGRSGQNLERQNIAREFKMNLERARFDAVKRRASRCNDMSRIEILSPTSYRVITDLDQNGTTLSDNGTPNDPSDDVTVASEVRTVDFANRSNVNIVGNSLVFPIVIRFDQRGNTSSGTCASPTATVPTTTFCNMPCTAATADSANANIVFVSPSGTTAILGGSETIPTFANANVSSVNTSFMVDNRLTVWTGTPPTPTPFPTSTPATPTPLPTVDPAPIGTPTPTPSPTPVACTYNQNPNTTPCTCIAPMYVVTNHGGNNPRCVGTTPTP